MVWCGGVRGTVGGVGGAHGECPGRTLCLTAYLCNMCVTLFRRPLHMWHKLVFLFLYLSGGACVPFIIILCLYNFVILINLINSFNAKYCKGDTECHYLITMSSW